MRVKREEIGLDRCSLILLMGAKREQIGLDRCSLQIDTVWIV